MPNILDNLNDPKEIQDFSVGQLNELAQDCRDKIIDVVSRTGGHLASSLGAVELTLALAKVFDLKEDKVIFDVGHQGYTYKLLTGRKDRLELMGQAQGISKFLSRQESEYDHFGAGHASTSISAALGFAVAREINQKKHNCIAVIGDGAMTGGLAFEGLNHAGHLDEDLIVILNDNEMSIDPVVGALSKTIINFSASKSFNMIRNEITKHSKDGAIPKAIHHTFKRVNDSFMAFFTHGVWFENLNFRYFGQVDGHNLTDLINVLNVTKNIKGPILIHVSTQKGKGYEPAEGDALSFHGVSAFDPKTGVAAPKKQIGKTYTNLFSQSMEEVLKTDPKAVAISAAMLGNTGLARLQETYGDRIFDVGIAEGHGVTFAAGLAAEGIKPFVVIYSTFLQRAFDHICHDVALQNLPVRFLIDRAGFVGPDGATHHGLNDLSYLRMIPGMAVLAPKNGEELQGMMKLAHNYDQGPLAIRFARASSEEYQEDLSQVAPIEWGKAELVHSGNDILLIAVGTMVETAERAGEILQQTGINPTIINARFIKPLDEPMILKQAEACKGVVTIEENVISGGFGSAVMEMLSRNQVYRPVLNLGIKDQYFEHATRDEQLQATGLDVDSVVQSTKDFFANLP